MKTHPPRSPKNTFSEIFHIKYFAFNIRWNKWNQYQFIDIDYVFVTNFCSIFSKDTKAFDFTKCNAIRKLAYKVKYIRQINGGLIMFSANSRTRFSKISWLDCEQYGKNRCKKKEHNQYSSVFKV